MVEADGPIEWAGDLSPGTTLLLAGPTMSGKRQLLHQILAGDRDDGAARVFVTTRKSADTVVEEYRRVHPDIPPEMLSVVDCVSDQRGVSTERSDTRRYASDPGDLTGIGIGVSEFMRRYHDDGVAGVRVGLHTLSTMLMYADLRRLYQFLHVTVGRIEASGYVGAFVVDETVGSERLNTLSQPFDGIVEVRYDDRREYRVRGIGRGPDDWTPY